MREIKFRAWDSFKNEWQYQPESGDFDFIDGLMIDYDKDRFILEQYIGLKDKSGKEIYEGDIVKPASEDNIFTKGQIEFDNESGAFVLKNEKGRWQRFNVTVCAEDIKIIGNIHEGVNNDSTKNNNR